MASAVLIFGGLGVASNYVGLHTMLYSYILYISTTNHAILLHIESWRALVIMII